MKKRVKGKKNKSIKMQMLCMVGIPLVAMSIVLSVIVISYFTKIIYAQQEKSLKNVAYIVANSLDKMYPGDYSVIKSDKYLALKKGDKYLSQEYFENLKEDIGMDFTIFYDDIRMITTIHDNSSGEAILGTAANPVIYREVCENGAKFYKDVKINNSRYFSYYMPLHNADGSVVGMMAILKPSKEVNWTILNSLWPIIIAWIVLMMVSIIISIHYSNKMINAVKSINTFLLKIKNGNLNTTPDIELKLRKDEFGEIAESSDAMRKSIKSLIEIDSLTGMYNRRYGNDRLKKIGSRSVENGSRYCVSIGDIDFFKIVNDTYGHDAGDCVLIGTSSILKRFMNGKGYVARWGGEEFLLVFEDMDVKAAEDRLNELLSEIRNEDMMTGHDVLHITMSFGVTQGHGNIEDDLKLADECLYEAKENGRNRVVS